MLRLQQETVKNIRTGEALVALLASTFDLGVSLFFFPLERLLFGCFLLWCIARDATAESEREQDANGSQAGELGFILFIMIPSPIIPTHMPHISAPPCGYTIS